MRNLAVMAFLSLAIAPPMIALAAGADTPGRGQSAVDEVRRLNTEEVDAFLHNDPKAMLRLWSDDFVVTNPLNKFATKQQVVGMMESGVLVITSYDRHIEYARLYHDDTVIVAGNETVVWGGKMPNAGKT